MTELYIEWASKVPCQMCRIKGGSNIEKDGGCRHRQGLTATEAAKRISYAIRQAANARELSEAVKNSGAIVGYRPAAERVGEALEAIKKVEEGE